MNAPKTGNDSASAPAKRWDIYEFAASGRVRSELLKWVRARFPQIPLYDAEEIVDSVIERSAGLPDEPGAYPDRPFEVGVARQHLWTCTLNACRNWTRTDHREDVDEVTFNNAVGSTYGDGEDRVRLSEILSDAEQHLDPTTLSYVQQNVAGYTRDDMQFTRRQIQRMREKWDAWAKEARVRVGALIPIPFLRRALEGGGGATAAGAGGVALSTKIAATCAAGVVCAAGIFGITKAVDDEPSHSEAAKPSSAAPVVSDTRPTPKHQLSDTERKDTKERKARTRRKTRTTDGSPAEREFGVEQTAATESPSQAPVAPSGDGCSNAAAGEFSVDC